MTPSGNGEAVVTRYAAYGKWKLDRLRAIDQKKKNEMRAIGIRIEREKQQCRY